MTYGYPPIYGTMRARIDFPETEADTHGIRYQFSC